MPVIPKLFDQPTSPSPTAPVTVRPHPKPPKPLLRLELRDLSDAGAKIFLKHIDASTAVSEAVNGVISHLYSPQATIPPTRSVTLILRAMDGVAYTTGKDIDDDHKEIHFSTRYIEQISTERQKAEMLGVLRHEMVHCYQWNGMGTAPGGLVEGIADWVRLRNGMAPPHWKKEAGGDWDAGYQHTGYFLEWLEQRCGAGTVMGVNERLRNKKYEEKEFWKACCGESVGTLWKEYCKTLGGDEDKDEEKAEQATEKNAEQDTEKKVEQDAEKDAGAEESKPEDDQTASEDGKDTPRTSEDTQRSNDGPGTYAEAAAGASATPQSS